MVTVEPRLSVMQSNALAAKKMPNSGKASGKKYFADQIAAILPGFQLNYCCLELYDIYIYMYIHSFTIRT